MGLTDSNGDGEDFLPFRAASSHMIELRRYAVAAL